MTTSIPPHNFGEVIDGVIAYMKDPNINTEQMMQYTVSYTHLVGECEAL